MSRFIRNTVKALRPLWTEGFYGEINTSSGFQEKTDDLQPSFHRKGRFCVK